MEMETKTLPTFQLTSRFDELLMNQSKILLKVELESFNIFAKASLEEVSNQRTRWIS